MTLIELTVVLLVLVGLAGLTLPYVGSFVSKTHNSTSADSGSALYSGLSTYQVQFQGLPNGLNSLLEGTGAFPASYLDNTFVTGATSAAPIYPATPSLTDTTNFRIYTPVTPATATAGNELASLNAAGITKLASLPTGTVTLNTDGTYTPSGAIAGTGATFTAEIAPATLTAASLFVSDANAAQGTDIATALNYTVPANHALIVLGVGASNAAIGKTLATVPVHFGDKGTLQPQLTYSRFLAAVDVDKSVGSGTVANPSPKAAKIIGIVHAPDTGDKWESLYSSISNYYTN